MARTLCNCLAPVTAEPDVRVLDDENNFAFIDDRRHVLFFVCDYEACPRLPVGARGPMMVIDIECPYLSCPASWSLDVADTGTTGRLIND